MCGNEPGNMTQEGTAGLSWGCFQQGRGNANFEWWLGNGRNTVDRRHWQEGLEKRLPISLQEITDTGRCRSGRYSPWGAEGPSFFFSCPGWSASSILNECLRQCPLAQCVPVIGWSLGSAWASLGKLLLGCWTGGSCLSLESGEVIGTVYERGYRSLPIQSTCML